MNASNELFGMERLVSALNIKPDCEPEKLMENVNDQIEEFVKEAPQFDDITMLCLNYRGNPV